VDVFTAVLRDARPFLRDAAIAAAHDLGLFAALPAPHDAIAARLGVSPRRLASLVRVLSLEAVLTQEGGIVRAPQVPPRKAVPPEGWGRLAQVVRTDRPLPSEGVDATVSAALRRFHAHLRTAGIEAAREIAALLGPGPLVDAGGGTGAYTAAYLEAYPTERAVLLDRPEVLELADEALAPLAGRVELVALDLLGSEPWPRGGCALLANVLHLYGSAEAADLVRNALRCVAPGGQVVIKDFLAGSDVGAWFDLNMALFSAAGQVHAGEGVQRWLREAGAREVRIVALECDAGSIAVLGTR
jgi:SAM-dependent methyltransferase